MILVIDLVHHVAKSFCEKIKLGKEMPKMPKLPERPKIAARLRRINFIKRKKQAMLLYSLTDFWFCILNAHCAYNKDGAHPAKAGHKFRHFLVRLRRISPL